MKAGLVPAKWFVLVFSSLYFRWKISGSIQNDFPVRFHRVFPDSTGNDRERGDAKGMYCKQYFSFFPPRVFPSIFFIWASDKRRSGYMRRLRTGPSAQPRHPDLRLCLDLAHLLRSFFPLDINTFLPYFAHSFQSEIVGRYVPCSHIQPCDNRRQKKLLS